MDGRVALIVYFLIAAAAAFVTASRNLPVPLLFLVLGALAIAAILIRNQVIGAGVRNRVSLGFIVVYLVTFLGIVVLEGR
jgi:hypothetical protein